MRTRLVVTACAMLLGCSQPPAPAPPAGDNRSGAVSVIPPVLSATQQLAADLASSRFGEGELPPGAQASAAKPSAPSPQAQALHAVSKVTFDVVRSQGANADDKIS